MKEITAAEFKQMQDSGKDFQLIDVREQHEYDEMNIHGEHIPMGEVLDRVSEIAKDKPVVVHCRSGKRSAAVIHALESQHGYTNLINLQGGILAYLELP
ncbi:MAG TPA: rhodanese-like domain-containing protein [Bacteroidia bacterium]|nr:rhodanese-like domain-containing protein [Bacteroidia bacterium]